MNLTQLTVVGTVATDVDTRTLTDGRRRARFRVAATSRILDPATWRWRNGGTTFLAVVAWRRVADAAVQLRRGARIVVIGALRQHDYARDGQRELGYEVQAQEIALCLPARPPITDPPGRGRGHPQRVGHLERPRSSSTRTPRRRAPGCAAPARSAAARAMAALGTPFGRHPRARPLTGDQPRIC